MAAQIDDVPVQKSFRGVYIALLMLVSLAALDQTVVSVALPSMVEDLGGQELYSWVGAAYLLASACLAPIYGKLADVVGRKPTVTVAIIAFLLGSLLCASAPTMSLLVVARAVQGIGGGGIIQMFRIIIADITNTTDRGKYLGGISAAWGASTTLGGFVGGALVSLISWRAIFYINIPIGLIASYLLLQGLNIPIKETRTMRQIAQNFDFVGMLLIAGGSAAFLASLNGGAWSLFTLVLSVGSLGYGAYHELNTEKSPIIPRRLFTGYPALVTFISGLHNLSAMVGAYYLPLYFQILGYTPFRSGLLTMPFAMGTTLTSTGIGFVLARFPRHRFFSITSLAVMTIGALCMVGLDTDNPVILQEITTLVAALGMGPLWTLTLVMLQMLMSKDDMATATTGFGLVRSLSGALGVTLGTSVYTYELSRHLPDIPGYYPELKQLPVTSLKSLRPDILRRDVVRQHVLSLRGVWIVLVPIAACALLLSFFLPTRLSTEMQQSGNRHRELSNQELDEELALLTVPEEATNRSRPGGD